MAWNFMREECEGGGGEKVYLRVRLDKKKSNCYRIRGSLCVSKRGVWLGAIDGVGASC